MSRPAAGTKRKSIYSVHPGVLMTQKWIAELKEKTGRSLEEWIKHIKKAGPKGEMERRQWLKDEYKLGTNSASWLTERADGKGLETGDPDLYLESAERDVDMMFSGGKANLRPIYDALLKLGLKVGKRSEGMSLPDHRSVIPESRLRSESNQRLKRESIWVLLSETSNRRPSD
jgi:hypothetical protein